MIIGRGYVGIAKEGSFGAGAAPTTFIPVNSVEMSSDPQTHFPEQIRASRSKTRAVPLGRKNSGSLEMDTEPATIGHLLLGALGGVTTTTPAAGVYQHIFLPALVLPSYSLERYDTVMIQRATGAKIDKLSLSLEAGGDGVLVASADFIVQTLADQAAAATPNYSDKNPFSYTNITVTKGGAVNNELKSFELNIENGLKDDQFTLRTSRDVQTIGEGMRTVSGSLEMFFKTKADYLAFMAGTADALKFEFTGAVIAAANSEKLIIELPNISYTSFDVPMGGADDEVLASMEFTAIYDSGIAGEIKVTLQNAVTSY